MSSKSLLSKNLPPLAERMRPYLFSDFIGQEPLTKENSLLNKSFKTNQPFSMIFWGSPGTGKTTLSRILSKKYNSEYFELSAISSGVKDVRSILQQGKANFDIGKKTILFIDEIHRFTKSQQDALLHAVEDGTIILIGATTENPSFEIISPLLSRCKVMRLEPLNQLELQLILNRALSEDILLRQRNLSLNSIAEELIINSCGGDARKMLNTLELAVSLIPKTESIINKNNILESLQQKNIIYDKSGDYHYDVISAYIKSIRGSDPDAAIYWLAVMLEGGEKPEFIARRLIVLASEDIGNAEPYALQLANAAFDAVNKIGMPESRIILSQITIYLAAIPKSNKSYLAIDSAINLIKKDGVGSVPIHLRNATTPLMKSIDYGKNYKYAHSYKNNFTKQNYFPDTFSKPHKFYSPSDEGREKFLKERLNKLWPKRYK